MSRRPRALITGFSGMVGSHLADYLLEHTDERDWHNQIHVGSYAMLEGLCEWAEETRP